MAGEITTTSNSIALPKGPTSVKADDAPIEAISTAPKMAQDTFISTSKVQNPSIIEKGSATLAEGLLSVSESASDTLAGRLLTLPLVLLGIPLSLIAAAAQDARTGQSSGH